MLRMKRVVIQREVVLGGRIFRMMGIGAGWYVRQYFVQRVTPCHRPVLTSAWSLRSSSSSLVHSSDVLSLSAFGGVALPSRVLLDELDDDDPSPFSTATSSFLGLGVSFPSLLHDFSSVLLFPLLRDRAFLLCHLHAATTRTTPMTTGWYVR